MEIILKVKPRSQNSVIRQIKKQPKKFTKIKQIDSYKDFHKKDEYVIVILNDTILNEQEQEKIKKKYQSLKNVTSIDISQTHSENFKNNIKDKFCHFFFDIDSTLTKGTPSTIHRKIMPIFKKLKEDHGYHIYFASGRSEPQVQDDIVDFETERYGIAENGGIIITGKNRYEEFGDRIEPENAFKKLRKIFKNKIREHPEAGTRLTEVVISNIIPEDKIKTCLKKMPVELNASKTSYHISKKGYNKGAALLHLTSKILKLGDNHVTIAIGDSDLDVPMFNEADYAFAVANASRRAKNAAILLGNSDIEGIREMYEKYFKL